MTKGKYAAKAKNRLANLDNEILQQVIAERDALREELRVAKIRHNHLTREVHSEAMRIGADLAKADIERFGGEIDELRAELSDLPGELFRKLMKLFAAKDSIPMKMLPDISELFGSGAAMGISLAEDIFPESEGHGRRDFRRRSSKSLRMINELRERNASSNGRILGNELGNVKQAKRFKGLDPKPGSNISLVKVTDRGVANVKEAD